MVLSVIVMGSAAAQTVSQDNQATFFETANQDVYRLVVDSPEKSKTAFNIYNERGKKIFSDIIGKTTAFTKTYNFQNFPIGMYQIEVEKNGKILEQTLSHFEKIDRPTFFVNLSEADYDNKVNLEVIGVDNQVVEVKIKDYDGQTIYVDKVSGVMGFKRTYDLTKVGTKVAFEVKVADEVINMRL